MDSDVDERGFAQLYRSGGAVGTEVWWVLLHQLHAGHEDRRSRDDPEPRAQLHPAADAFGEDQPRGHLPAAAARREHALSRNGIQRTGPAHDAREGVTAGLR